ncbi:MAG: bifunctional demethylmenaquinone methyltransferase/2-methoxy-6-polyprenyl-1,4-benzoquinol methylase UbiE [Pseudomonadota bacterium]
MADPADRLARSFGFENVDPAAKASLVRNVFDSVAGRYDLMNDLMSLGVHRLWKDALVDWLAPRPGLRHVDLAGGTGDVAFRIRERAGGEGEIVVVDINEQMIRVGRDRAFDRNAFTSLHWVVGDAMALPLADRSHDSLTIAFGIRNVTHIDRALAEAFRILKPGGRFLCLEFSKVTLPVLEQAYDAYSFGVLPRLGSLVAGDAASYRYLAESIRRFPSQDEFKGLMEAAGFEQVRYRNLSSGIACIHSGWRL